MPVFGKRSLHSISSIDERLQRVLFRAIKNGPDFSVIVGHRNRSDQNRAFTSGHSKKKWPQSKHNRIHGYLYYNLFGPLSPVAHDARFADHEQ